MSNIAQAIRELAKGGKPTTSLICIVDSVDKDARTIDCTPLNESAPILGANLQANQNSSCGVVSFPRVGSYVVVGFVADGNAGVVLCCDDIEHCEISIKDNKVVFNEDGIVSNIADTKIEITKDGIVINGGDFGGLVKIKELEDNLKQLKDYVVAMKDAVYSGINAVGVSTAANGPTGANTFNTQMATKTISFKDMENSKIKQ